MNYRTSIDRVSDDHIYYNIIITNTKNVDIPATFEETRTEPIIKNMEDFHISVVRFTVPTDALPIIGNFKSYPANAGSTGSTASKLDAQNNGYSITTAGATASSQQFLTYVPIGPQTNPVVNDIFSYQQLMDMMNVALASGATALGQAIPPYMAFDSASQLFSLFIPDAYVTNGIQLWFNLNLQILFPSFPVIFYNHVYFSTGATATSGNTGTIATGEYALLPVNNLNNPNQKLPVTSGYHQLINEYPSTISLYQPRSLRFVAGNVPSRPEFLPNANTNPNTNDSSNGGQNNNFQTILTDFDLPISFNVANIKPFVQFYTTGPYRLIDLKSYGPLKQFDITVYWVDNLGVLYPLLIPPQQTLSIKFLFLRRGLFNNF